MKNKIVFEEPHGNNSFPISLHYTDNKLYEDIIYCHWHSDIEILYVTEGALNLQIDMNSFTIKEGEAAIINSGEVHFGNSNDGNDCSVYAIVFSPMLLNFNSFDICQSKYISPFMDNKYKLPNYIRRGSLYEKEILNNILKIITTMKEEAFGYELKVKATLYAILSDIISNNAFTENTEITNQKQYKIDRLKKVLDYIQNNYMNKIYISDLAEIVSMSEDNLFKFFKTLTGKTPIGYINLYRIEMAEGLLRNDCIPLTEICFSVGFDNISYFIKTFKKYKNCTPKEYRKKLLQNL
ncbi:AraC family transcriptional regulator [Clostridium beijerinckii]|uniref:AraC family transcriptional regulator n=1 Tax=Clostridium beijerinckii TaxID=1520 RepID=UPI0014943864|nr:AraC family transcriptional regulator [Clostridium beijerinckii]NOW06647.1 AraC-like DNA-binding protein [Clostridium beijerinckii]NYC00209.1 AraC-like DNA-binding protein [Clostridium beijerinckii]